MPYCTRTWGHCDKLSKQADKPLTHFCGRPLDPREKKHVHNCVGCGAKP